MFNIKRGMALMLAMVMVAALTACAGGGGAPAASTASSAPAASTADSAVDNAPASTENANIQLWHIHTAETRKLPIEKAVKRFEEANPGVSVEITILENDPYKTKLRTVMGSGDAPDIFHSWGGGWLKSFVDEGLVLDITDDIENWKGDLSEAAVGMNTFNGKVWGTPIFNSSTPLFYNKALFEQYGLQPPTTLEELDQVAETLKSNGVIPFAAANLTKWPGAQHFVMLSMRIGGPDIFQRAIDGQVSFEDPAFIQAGEILQGMVDKGYFPDGVNALNWDTGDSRQMFYAGQGAMLLQTSGFVAACKSENEDFFNNNLGIASYPTVEGGVGKITDLLAGENALSVSTNSKHPEVSVKLIEFLSTDMEFQQELADNGTIGARNGLTATTPVMQDVMNQISEATYLQNFIDQTLSPELAEKHKDTCQALFGKTMTSAEAAAEMQKLYDSTK